jgi:hypothetical protein
MALSCPHATICSTLRYNVSTATSRSWSRDSSVSIASRLQAGRQGQENILLSIASRRVLRPTQSPIQLMQEALTLGVRRQGRESEHSPPSIAGVKNGGAIPSLPHMLSWHSA